jgi:ATP-dependent RNA helicase DDX52/ROK1
MDSQDLFKRLTSNLNFERNTNSHKVDLKRKLIDEQKNSTETLLKKAKIKTTDKIKPVKSKSALKNQRKKIKIKNLKLSNDENTNRIRNTNQINIVGSDCPAPIENLNELFFTGFDDANAKKTSNVEKCLNKLIENFNSYNFTELTPIQMQVMPIMANNRELLACAPTGSGKTLAFLFPMLFQLIKYRSTGVKSLVLAPTKELAHQIFIECRRISVDTETHTQLIDSSVKSLKALMEKCDVLITTPNRLIFMLTNECMLEHLKKVEWMIIDEADKLFDNTSAKDSFREQLGKIFKACDNPKVKHALFSATYSADIKNWCKSYFSNMIRVTIGKTNRAPVSLTQEVVFVGNEEGKLIAIRNLLREGFEPPILIFVENKERANSLFKELIYENVNVDVINADRSQLQRENTIRSFRQGKLWVLISTELISRGIDFKGVKLIVNYDFPTSAPNYIHRIGRAGRAGKTGKAITFCTHEDLPKLKNIAGILRSAGCVIPESLLQYKKPLNKRKKEKLSDKDFKEKINKLNKKRDEKRDKLNLNNKIKKKTKASINKKKRDKKKKDKKTITKKVKTLKKSAKNDKKSVKKKD